MCTSRAEMTLGQGAPQLGNTRGATGVFRLFWREESGGMRTEEKDGENAPLAPPP